MPQPKESTVFAAIRRVAKALMVSGFVAAAAFAALLAWNFSPMLDRINRMSKQEFEQYVAAELPVGTSRADARTRLRNRRFAIEEDAGHLYARRRSDFQRLVIVTREFAVTVDFDGSDGATAVKAMEFLTGP